MTNLTTNLNAFALAARQGLTPEPLDILGAEVLVKLTNTDTNGAAAIFHLTAPPMSGPPVHRHSREDEWFLRFGRRDHGGDRWPANRSAGGRLRFCAARHRAYVPKLWRRECANTGDGNPRRLQPIL
jgi:hypothetical protein